MTVTNEFERDFNDTGFLRRPGRVDMIVFQNTANAGDGYPGLQRAFRNYLHEGGIEKDIQLLGFSIKGDSVDINNAEMQQLSNIGAVTINGTQWGYVGGANQNLRTTDSPTFGGLILSADIVTTSTVDGVDVSALSISNQPNLPTGDVNFNNKGLNNLDNIDEKVYYVSTDAELDNAISDIQTNNVNGRIIIQNDIGSVQVNINDSSASFIIEGSGGDVTLTPNGDNNVFLVQACAGFVLRHIKIDVSAFTVESKQVIKTQGGSNVIIDSVTITGDGVNGLALHTESANTKFINCKITSMWQGMTVSAVDCVVYGNLIDTMTQHGIQASSLGDRAIIGNNIIKNCTSYGISISATNTDSVIGANLYNNNGTDINDAGTNTKKVAYL